MKRLNVCRGLIPVFMLIFAGSLVAPSATYGQDADSLITELAECAKHYWGGATFQEGIELAQSLLTRGGLTTQDSVAIFEVLSALNWVGSEHHRKKSIDYLNKINAMDPCIIPLPRKIWAPDLQKQWYEITDGTPAFTCASQSQAGVKSIAIMEFDNHSVTKYVEELGSIGKGLADMFHMDFSKISSLHVVERSKINYILKEKKLQQSGDVDRATAVKAGKLLGAHYMIFGSFMQMDKNNTAMMVKVVSVETSEIIASVDRRGKPDYWGFCKELVIELAGQLDITLGDDIKKLIKQGGTESMDATALYSKGLEYSDRYDYRKAYDYFKKAYELDSNFIEAKQKMDNLRPLAG
jgi:TolB-like protein